MVRTQLLQAFAYGGGERLKLCIWPTTISDDIRPTSARSNDPGRRRPLDVHVEAASTRFGEYDDCSFRWDQPDNSHADINSHWLHTPRMETSFLRYPDSDHYTLSDTGETGDNRPACRFFQIQEMTDIAEEPSPLHETHREGPYARLGFILDPQVDNSSATCSLHSDCTSLTAKALIVSDLYPASLIGKVDCQAPSTQTASNQETVDMFERASGQETEERRGQGQEEGWQSGSSQVVTNLPIR